MKKILGIMKFFVSIVLSLVVVSSCVQDAKYLKQSELIKYAKHAPTVLPNLKANAPFDKLEFDKVIAYDFDGDYETYSSVIHRSLFFRKKKYVPVIINQNHLNQEQVNFVTSFLSDTLTYGESIAACFEPHLGLAFYKNDNIVYEVSICLDCNYLRSTETIPATYYFKNPYGEGAEGFSDSGIENITKLCRELGLDYGEFKKPDFEDIPEDGAIDSIVLPKD